jgi:hypothetical protein
MLTLLLAVVVAGACSSDPKQIRLAGGSPDSVLAILQDRKGLSVEETRLMYAYAARMRMESVESSPPDLAGRTVGELIEEQRHWENTNAEAIASGQRHASEWKSRVASVVREMDENVTVRVLEKRDPESSVARGNAQRNVVVRLRIENVGTRHITEIEGAVRFTDVYDRDLFDCSATIREPLAAGETIERVVEIGCTPFMDQERSMRHVRLADTKVAWEPRMIRFEDGSTLAPSDE